MNCRLKLKEVAVERQTVVQRDTLEVYEVVSPESIKAPQIPDEILDWFHLMENFGVGK